MSETCKTCHKRFNSGIWVSPQFNDKKVLLFCSDKCKNKYLKMKLERTKAQYPKYYEKMMKSCKNPDKSPFWLRKEKMKQEGKTINAKLREIIRKEPDLEGGE